MFEAGAVIIAAGLSSRMGDFKPLLPLGDTTVIRKLIRTLQCGGVKKIVVVTGYRGDELMNHINDMHVTCVPNDYYAQSQMFDSAKIGFSAIRGLCKKVLFLPVDIPLFDENTVRALLNQNANLICPVWQGKKGHPICIADEVLDSLIHYNGDYGLHGAFQHCGYRMEFLEVEDWGILYDMDTKKDYRKIKMMYDMQNSAEN